MVLRVSWSYVPRRISTGCRLDSGPFEVSEKNGRTQREITRTGRVPQSKDGYDRRYLVGLLLFDFPPNWPTSFIKGKNVTTPYVGRRTKPGHQRFMPVRPFPQNKVVLLLEWRERQTVRIRPRRPTWRCTRLLETETPPRRPVVVLCRYNFRTSKPSVIRLVHPPETSFKSYGLGFKV